MNQENFEQAYVESQAQIAFVLAESLGLISEQRRSLAKKAIGAVTGIAKRLMAKRKPGTGPETKQEPEMSQRMKDIFANIYTRRMPDRTK